MQILSLDGPVDDSLEGQLGLAFPGLGSRDRAEVLTWIVMNRDHLLKNAASLPPASFSGGQPLQALMCCLRPLLPRMEPRLLEALCKALDYRIYSLTFVPDKEHGINLDLERMEDW